MFPPFPQELARHYCLEFIKGIEDGSVVLKQVTPESKERRGHGVMIGALVCSDSRGQRVVLHAVSGVSLEAKGCVPSIVSSSQIEKALSKNDVKIHELTSLINQGHEEYKDQLALCYLGKWL